MPIQSGDVKFLKSAVMADVPEGGGAPTGLVIADGVSNAPGPGTNYTFDFHTLPGMVSGTVVTLKCGPPQDTAMYTITTRIP